VVEAASSSLVTQTNHAIVEPIKVRQLRVSFCLKSALDLNEKSRAFFYFERKSSLI
jgi:hypothetical protein